MIIEHTRVSFLAFPLLLSHSISLSSKFKLFAQKSKPQSSLHTNLIQQYFLKMALMVNATSLLSVAQHSFPSLGLTSSSPRILSCKSFKCPLLIQGPKTRAVFPSVFALKNRYDTEVAVDIVVEDKEDEAVTEKPRTETLLYSFTPLPLLFVAALPGGNVNHPRKFINRNENLGNLPLSTCFISVKLYIQFVETDGLNSAEAVRSVFGPFVELVKSWNLPDWLVHWGHPGNMVRFSVLRKFDSIDPIKIESAVI